MYKGTISRKKGKWRILCTVAFLISSSSGAPKTSFMHIRSSPVLSSFDMGGQTGLQWDVRRTCSLVADFNMASRMLLVILVCPDSTCLVKIEWRGRATSKCDGQASNLPANFYLRAL
jgi:hypothetical protein